MAHPLVTELLAAARAAHITQPDLTARAGIYARSVSYWKVARFGPSVGLLDAAAEVVGLKLALVPIDYDPTTRT